jgi:uncharacterized protein (TIRG00374 family)
VSVSKNQTLSFSKALIFFQKNRYLINLLIVALFIYVVSPQINKFRESLGLIHNLNIFWLIAGFIFSMLTYFLSAYSYFVLAKKPIKYSRTILTQGASMFANHLLPAGIGSMGVGYQYLRKNKHTKSEAIAVVYINNILGFLGYILILTYIWLFTDTRLNISLRPHVSLLIIILIILVVSALVLVFIKHKKIRKSLSELISQIHQNVYGYRKNKLDLLLSFLSIMGLTGLYGLSLCACALAIGFHINFAESLIVLALGVIGKTIVPTPGGLIGAEAGIFAGLLACGANASEALIIIVTYRLLTYWIPFAIGAAAFARVRQKQYI